MFLSTTTHICILKFYKYFQLHFKFLITYKQLTKTITKHRNIKSPDSSLASSHPRPIRNSKVEYSLYLCDLEPQTTFSLFSSPKRKLHSLNQVQRKPSAELWSRSPEGKGYKKSNKYKMNQIINGKQILLTGITNIKTYTHILQTSQKGWMCFILLIFSQMCSFSH